MTDYCHACRKPFDEVHPLDFMNDFTCKEMAPPPSVQQSYPNGYRSCRRDHTWREHVAESWKGQWFNPHYRIPEWEVLSDDMLCESKS